MRIWDTDPRQLCNRHLLGQHVELHCMYSVIDGNGRGWSNHPETVRFKEHPHGLQWLAFVHECMRLEMNVRWPGNHAGHVHPSPVLLTNRDMRMLVPYATGGSPFEPKDWMTLLTMYDYPPTQLEHGNPWERDGVAREWYLEHQKDWSHALVQRVHEEAKALADTDLQSMTRGADVSLAGDGRPHVS